MGRAEPSIFITYDSSDKSLVNQVRRAILAQIARGGSYADLAERSGLVKQQVGRFVRGERDLTLASASRIMMALGMGLVIPEDLRTVPDEELVPRDPRGGRPTRVGKSPDSPAAKVIACQDKAGPTDPDRALHEAGPALRVESSTATHPGDYREQLLHEAAHMAMAYLVRREEAAIRVTIQEIRREMAANTTAPADSVE
jgi:DNA-binding phage protein